VRTTSARLALCALALVAVAAPAAAQEAAAPAATPAAESAPAPAATTPPGRPSPMGMARTTLDGDYVRVVYSRPYKKGRAIFGTKESGALVPFGQVWRTGANEATEITLTGDMMVAGQKLAAGTYSLFTTPGPEQWQVHFNSALGLDGTGHFDPVAEKFTPADLPKTNVLTVNVPATTLAEDKAVDQLTFSFEQTDAGADMVLRWDRTEVRVPLQAAP
jgi:hypothetical protein